MMISKNYFSIFLLTFFVAGFFFLVTPDKAYSGNPTGCCVKDGTNVCFIGIDIDCMTGDDVFGGDGTTCSDDTCTAAIKGCCVQNGTCTDSNEFACGDTFTAKADQCFSGTSCETPRKGCCVKAGTNECLSAFKDSCEADGDVFGGEGAACDNSETCSAAIKGCCVQNGTCTDSNEFACGDTFTAKADQCFSGTSCETPPTGCCILPVNGVANTSNREIDPDKCIVISEAQCNELNGEYKGDGSTPEEFPEQCSFSPPPPTNIPTIGQWGMIAMAGLLGIFSLFIIMRRHRYNVS